jgi:hypothetical protein
MRTMLKVTIPATPGSEALKNGSLPRIIQSTLETLKPEAAYFTTENGKRTAFIFFELKSQSDIPSIAEPFFSGMGAEVTFTPAMNAEDLKAGLQHVMGKP